MNGRRSNLQIIAEMLRLSLREAGKTRLMYNVNMSHSQLERYLAFLLERGFLEEVDNKARNGSVRYRTTSKGRELLREIERMMELLGLEDCDGDEKRS